MANANFTDILNRPSEEIKPAPVLPQGSYHAVVLGLPEQGESSQKKTPQLKFILKILAPLEDVSEDDIAEFEALGEKLVGQEIENILYITDKSAIMLKEFILNCGVDLSGRSLAEGLDDTPNVPNLASHDKAYGKGRTDAPGFSQEFGFSVKNVETAAPQIT